MGFETKISVPTRDLARLANILTRSGCVILDTGERTTTEEGLSAEACLNVLFVEEEALEAVPLGVSR